MYGGNFVCPMFTLLICLLTFSTVQCEGDVIQILTACGDSVEESVDRAKIYFDGGVEQNNLFAVNSQCYRCSKTLVSNGTINNCASLFTPHYWRLYIESKDGIDLASTDYTFGEWGEYSVKSVGSSISVIETKQPINSLEPLWILVGVLIAIIAFSFSWSYIHDYVKSTFFIDDTATANTTYSAVPLVVNDNGDIEDSKTVSSAPIPQTGAPKKPARLSSLDTFRGFSLALMIFVNYGYGGYWFFDHAAWNGLTFADLVFPWFMWMMGVSMALSFASLLPKQPSAAAAAASTPPPGVSWEMWKHVTRRSVTLFLLGMFIANGWEYTTWRVPGVLQYFAVSYFVTSATVLSMFPYTRNRLQSILSSESKRQSSDLAISLSVDNGASSSTTRYSSYLDLRYYPRVLTGYSYEWLIQGAILFVYLAIHLGGKAPGCPRGYVGPGGIGEHTDYQMCTGGIHRYIDMHAFGYKFIYHHPTCLDMYQCRPFDPEGLLGTLSACTLTYLGLMSGRVVLHFKEHTQRLTRFLTWAFWLLLLAGILCGFSQDGGAIPINKNLWSTSFVLVTAGSGLIGLSVCYVLVDVLKWWSGAPFLYLGMNSILIYVSHGILAEYMPFSYKIYHVNHATLLQCHVLGVTAWMIVAYYFYRIKFFVKI